MDIPLYAIELNLDADFADSQSYIIDTLEEIILKNGLHALNEHLISSDRYVIVGIAPSIKKATEMAEIIRKELCDLRGKEPKNSLFRYGCAIFRYGCEIDE